MPELRLKVRFLLLGIALVVSYWLVETVADSVFGGEGPVADRLFPADANEVWMRLIIVALILAFTAYTSHTLERRARIKQRLRVLESAVEHTDDAVLISTAELDPPGPKIVYINRAFCQQTGYAAEELLGETPRMLQGRDSDRAVLDQLRTCLESKEHFVGCLTNYRKDGSSFRVELRISPVYDAAGDVTHWISVQHDITERERAEAALKESEERYRLLIESAEDYAIFMVDPDGRILSWNEGAERVFGYGEGKIVGKDGSLLFTPEDRRRGASEQDLRQAETEGRAEGEGWYVRKDGSRFWGSGSVRPVRDAAGVLRGFTKVVRDTTERKRAEEALRESEERYRTVVESSDDAIIGTTVDEVITGWNKGAQKLYGYTAEEAVGQRLSMVAPPEKQGEIAEIPVKIRSGEAIHNLETVLLAKDGRPIDVSLTVSPVRKSEGSIVGASVIARDITERKRTESALREVREAERRQIARDLHDEVLQELMDALYSLQITRVKLRDEEIDIPEIDEQIEDLRKANHSLRDAINNLRQESIREQPFLRLLRGVVLRNRQKAPHIHIDLDVDASFSSECLGSTGIELLRIVQEALVNVRRHSWAHHVRVSLRKEKDFVIVEVVDDGRGFDPEVSWGGVGLSAMQERASKLGSDLEVHSEPGKGTRVTVRASATSVLAVGAANNPSEI